MEQNCLEQILDDVIQIDFVKASECDIQVPFQVPVIKTDGKKSVNGSLVDRIGTPSLSIKYVGNSESTAEFESAPSIKQKEVQQIAGYVVEHSLKIPVSNDYENVRESVNDLRGEDFNVVFYTAGGERYLCYSLPESSSISIDDSESVVETLTVNASLQSMSHIIRLL